MTLVFARVLLDAKMTPNNLVCMAKAKFNTKNETKRQLLDSSLVLFLGLTRLLMSVKKYSTWRSEPYRGLFWFSIFDIRDPDTELENRDDHQKQDKMGFVSGVHIGPLAATCTS